MNGNGVPMPVGGHHSRSTSGQYMRGGDYAATTNSNMSAFAGARSPPKAKNTSHVPCKFFPYGQCQAGAACQFSHDVNATTQNAPCKYFSKGSCKFGQGCALAHVLPDGRVINRPPRPQPGFSRRGHATSMNGGLPNSLLSMQVNDPMTFQQVDPATFAQQEQNVAYNYQPASPPFGPQQTADVTSPYGSPFAEGRLATSPTRPSLTALDAHLPKSFDSQGISHAARHGPFAASVPNRFLLDPQSPPNRAQLGNTAMRDAAYGDTANLDGVLHGLGSSPRDNPALDFSKRPLHSERFAAHRSRPMMMSSSLGGRPAMFIDTDESAEDEGSDSGAGEDLLPSSLHDLIPHEKLRRSSRNALENESSALPMTSAQRRAISNGATPSDSKTGSLSPHSGSPSRYSSIWAAKASTQKTENDTTFGHVGSPLRPSNLRSSSISMSTSPNNAAQDSMSILTSQLRNATVADNSKLNAPTSHPGMSRNLSSSSNVGRLGLGDRGFSSSSVGREKIDEEAMFSMEEEDGDGSLPRSANGNASFRKGATPVFSMGKGAATLSPLGGQRPR